MRQSGFVLFLACLMAFAFSCKEPNAVQPSGPPSVTTDQASNVTGTTASLHGEVNPNGTATTYHFEYGLSTSYGYTTKEKNAGSGTSAVIAIDTVTGLSPVTLYYYRLVGASSAGIVNATGLTFTTGLSTPIVTTDSATNVTPWSAVLNATVNPNAQLTTYLFEYGTTSSYGSTTPTYDAGGGVVPLNIIATVNGLQPGTGYHFRIVATNPVGTVRGTDQSFATKGVVEFNYPLTIGTTWQYDYEYSYSYMGQEMENRSGLHTWTVSSIDIAAGQTIATLSNTKRDSVYQWRYWPPFDTTFIREESSSFTIVVAPDTIYAHWPGSGYLAPASNVLSVIPRFITNGTDTVKVGDQYGDFKATYLSGVGLLRYVGGVPAFHKIGVTLTLISLSKR